MSKSVRPYQRPLVSSGQRRAMVVAILAIVLVLVRYFSQAPKPPPPPESMAEGDYTVERVVDGDTLLLTNHARVRLTGANTPETVKPNHPVEPFGPEASEFTKQFIASGDGTVRLQFDRERIDKHGRFLAYVFVGSQMLNEELIRSGLATAETRFNYSSSMKTRFRRAEKEAQVASRGIWSLPANAMALEK